MAEFETMEVQDLLVKRGKYKRSFTRFYDKLKQDMDLPADSISVATLESDIDELNKSMDVVFNLYDCIVEKLENEPGKKGDLDGVESWYLELSQLHMSLRKTALSIIEMRKSVTPTKPKNKDTCGNTSLKLERVVIPKFDGTIQSYIAFKRNFLYLTKTLNEQDKHLQLRTCITSTSLRNRIMNFNSFDDAWQFLEKRYGDHTRQYRSLIEEIDKVPKLNSVNGEVDSNKLDEFLQKLHEFNYRFDALGKSNEFNSEFMVSVIVKKIPDYLVLKWEEEVVRGGSSHDALSLIEFLDHQLDHLTFIKSKLSKPVPSYKSNAVTGSSKVSPNSVSTNSVSPNSVSVTPKVTPTCVIHKTSRHNTVSCHQFISMSPDKRSEIIKSNKACFKCLKMNCNWKTCDAPVCVHCSKRHHVLLHPGAPLDASADNFTSKSDNSTATTNNKITLNITATDNASEIPLVNNTGFQCESLLPIVTVKASKNVHDKSDSVLGNLLFDCGSQISLVRRSFANKIGMDNNMVKMNLNCVGQVQKNIVTDTCSFFISSLDDSFHIMVEKVPILNEVCGQLNIVEDSYFLNYAHLKDLEFANCNTEYIDILIGVDYPSLHTELD